MAISIHHRIFSTIIGRSKRISLPGFDGLPIHDVAIFFIQGIRNGIISTRASSLSFHFFLALFPGMIFLFTLIPYIPIDNFQYQLLILLKDIMPAHSFEGVRETLEDIINHKRSGLLSVGFLAMIYFSSNGVNAMISAFNNSYHTAESRSVIRQRGVAIVTTFTLLGLLLSAIPLMMINKAAFDFMNARFLFFDFQISTTTLFVSRWLVLIFIYFLGISFVYYYAPTKRKQWRFISAGSTLTTICSLLLLVGFNYFVTNIVEYNKIYGSIGTLIMILIWIYMNSIILLIGFELNASIGVAGKKGNSHSLKL